MLRNYFKMAIRAIGKKNKIYSLINILGLSIGMASSLLILLFVSHEFSFDRFHSKANRIYQVVAKVNYGGQEINAKGMSAQFGPLTLQNEASVENFVRLKEAREAIVKVDNKEPLFENKFLFSDTSFFSVFSFPLLSGNTRALAEPNKLIISQRASKKYFGDSDPIGRTITYNKNIPFEVVGVAQNPPSNSSIQFDFIASFVTLGSIESEKNQYEHEKASLGSYPTYFLLKGNVAKNKVEKSMMKLTSASIDEKYLLTPILDQHLYEQANNSYLYGFLIIALIILSLALINYISLTTARATARAKEVGIRKVIGAQRKNLSVQFFLESTLMTVLAFLLAIVLIEVFLPVFLEKIQLTIDFKFIQSPVFIGITSGLLLICIFVSGSYPALVLSKFKPINTLKGNLSGLGQAAWLRKGLTTFQFAASIGLILCSMIILQQMDFLKNQKLGLTKDMVMVVNLDRDAASHYGALKNDLRNQSGVLKVSSASFTLFNGGTSAFFTQTPITKEDIFINTIDVDDQFFSTLDIQWKVKPEIDKLSGKYIVNETGLAKLKMTQEDLGKTISLGRFKSEITGIIKDFNFESLNAPVNGMIITVQPDSSNTIAKYGGAMYIRFEPTTQLTGKLQSVREVFKKYQGDRPFEYYFLDDAFDKLFKSEDRMSKIFNVFTFIAIFIACLGLLGLVTFTSEIRTKEIGIRKILGASAKNITVLLTKDYFVLITISMFLATPVAWWYMQKWLNGFPIKIEIQWWYVPLSTLFALTIAFITTCYQAIRCAVRNPVESLKTE